MAKENPRMVSRGGQKIRGYRFDSLLFRCLSILVRNARCAPDDIIVYSSFGKVNGNFTRYFFLILTTFDHMFWPFHKTEYTERTEIMWLFVRFGLQNRTMRTKKDAKNSHGAAWGGRGRKFLLYASQRLDRVAQVLSPATSLPEREVLDARKLAIPSLRSLHSDQNRRFGWTSDFWESP